MERSHKNKTDYQDPMSWKYMHVKNTHSSVSHIFCHHVHPTEGTNIILFLAFYPTALKDCRGIGFTHDVQIAGQVGGGWENVCPGCISETIRCRKLILGRDIGWGL